MGLGASHLPDQAVQDCLETLLDTMIKGQGMASGDYWIVIEGIDLLAVATTLKTHPDLAFDQFVDLCGVDYWPKAPRFEVVIHLYSTKHRCRVRVRAVVATNSPQVPSLTSLWKAANWQEREAYDMYGILFDGHPDLRRILSPPGLQVHPQRKDYPLKGPRDDGGSLS